MPSPVVHAEELGRTYPAARGDAAPVHAFDGFSMRVEAGQTVAIVGPSGSGKSTLLRILGCLDKPDRGRYRLLGRDIRWNDPASLAASRRCHISFVLQSCFLVPHLTLIENIELPLRYAGSPSARQRAGDIGTHLGLERMLHRYPHELSGGERQRASIARAFVPDASVVLADEPTGHLDAGNGALFRALVDRAAERGAAVIIATHDSELAASCDNVLTLDAAADSSPTHNSIGRGHAGHP